MDAANKTKGIRLRKIYFRALTIVKFNCSTLEGHEAIALAILVPTRNTWFRTVGFKDNVRYKKATAVDSRAKLKSQRTSVSRNDKKKTIPALHERQGGKVYIPNMHILQKREGIRSHPAHRAWKKNKIENQFLNEFSYLYSENGETGIATQRGPRSSARNQAHVCRQQLG